MVNEDKDSLTALRRTDSECCNLRADTVQRVRNFKARATVAHRKFQRRGVAATLPRTRASAIAPTYPCVLRMERGAGTPSSTTLQAPILYPRRTLASYSARERQQGRSPSSVHCVSRGRQRRAVKVGRARDGDAAVGCETSMPQNAVGGGRGGSGRGYMGICIDKGGRRARGGVGAQERTVCKKKLGWNAPTMAQCACSPPSLITSLSEAACSRRSIAEAVQDVDVAAFKMETGTEVIEAIVAERTRR
ncbi:hypothetical protein DFH08DRAFT_812483 [Mycena albidolilacea]|uniref:Uncharacterized protein n=1 Tax=Mycena albidolilacea TaxID=1033008 RepID=A0AAD6ZTI0_9AGAR|nr:hypothetical protein DFH08DRAFT_812483 [Mycena albidolilacea]